MKLLVLGVDAATNQIFNVFDMPFLNGLLKATKKVNVNEDLISRGWVEAYTGKHAIDTMGLYEMPVLNKSYESSLNFSLKTLDNEVSPIWEKLNEMGFSVGIMNVPTTNPAPEVNGFFVCGAGGGRALNASFDNTFCSSEEVIQVLNETGYIVDERVPSLLWDKKLFDEEKFFDRLLDMVERRIDSFLKLDNKYSVDFGFLVIRAVAVVQYLAMAEIQRVIEDKSPLNKRLSNEIKRFYKFLDGEFQRLFEGIKPDEFILISDHGMVPLKGTINFNELIESLGFQRSIGSKGLKRNLIDKFKHYIPYKLRQKLKSNKSIKTGLSSMISFQSKSTAAFSIGVLPGVYINDSKRFGGIVSDDQKDSLINDIICKINQSEFARKHNLKAHRSTYKGKYETLFPDIQIDMPDYLKPSSKGRLFEANKWLHKPICLKTVRDDNWTGVKGKETLFYVSDGLAVNQSKSTNLTLTYSLTIQLFEK